jgi:deazaflavin-dependent oxidoreductase (nitroreductase family)
MGWYDRAAVVFASSRPGAWFFVHVAMRLDRWLVPLTRGYVRDGRDIVLVGSKGGDPRHPAWIHNVRANPRVTVYARGQRGSYTAREAQGEERRRLWARAVALYPGYATYRARAAKREIPVVVLSPT